MIAQLTDHPLARDLDEILDHTRDVWEGFRGTTVYVTGGTGFVGIWLLESLLWANDRLSLGAGAKVLTRNPDGFSRDVPGVARQVELVRGDVRTPYGLEGCTHLIHAAAETRADRIADEPAESLSVSVLGTESVLDAAKKAGISDVLFTSSGAAYGSGATFVEEESSGAPVNAYGEGKRQAEKICGESGLDVRISRCFSFVGPYLPLDRSLAASNFLRDALNGGPIRVQGAGSSFRSYMYGSDMAAWLWTIFAKGDSRRLYNVGSAHRISTAAFAQEIAEIAGTQTQLVNEMPVVSLGASDYVPNTDRARSELGLMETVDLREAIRRTLQWHRDLQKGS